MSQKMKNCVDYALVKIDELGNLYPATQIAVKRSFKDMDPALAVLYLLFSEDEFYFHHGVYLGDSKVAHFYGENKDDAKPCECDILPFIKGAEEEQLYRVEYKKGTKLLDKEETLARAKEMLENPNLWKPYHVTTNNCESFATWLKTDVCISEQAMKAIEKGFMTAGQVAAMAVSSIRASGKIATGLKK